MSSYLRPRRGKKSTAIAQLTSANPLKRGEIFFEVPDDGVGTGPGKIKMGDGTTGYEDLPYFSEGIGGTDVTIALPTSGWGAETISGETYYTQTVTVLGATANSTPIIVPVFSTDAEMEAYTNILRVETSSNAFKFIAIAAPEASLTVVAKSVLEATGSQTADLSQITSHLNTIDGQITQLNNDLTNVETDLSSIGTVYHGTEKTIASIPVSTETVVNEFTPSEYGTYLAIARTSLLGYGNTEQELSIGLEDQQGNMHLRNRIIPYYSANHARIVECTAIIEFNESVKNYKIGVSITSAHSGLPSGGGATLLSVVKLK